LAKPSFEKPNPYKSLFFSLVFIIIVTVVGGAFYFLRKQQVVKPEISPTPTLAPTETIAFPPYDAGTPAVSEEQVVKDQEVVPDGANTVSFTRFEGTGTYLKYRRKIYDGTDPNTPRVVQLPDADKLQWYALVDSPPGVVPDEFMNDELFAFKVAPDIKSFAFVMRWGVNQQPQDYHLFYYTPFDKYRQSILVKKFPSNDPTKLDLFSADGKYLSLKLYDCWNCGGHQPETMLVRLSDNETKNIGKTSYFNWLTDGKYEYKDYVVIACTEETMGECSEKPEKLPLKSGQF